MIVKFQSFLSSLFSTVFKDYGWADHLGKEYTRDMLNDVIWGLLFYSAGFRFFTLAH